MRRHKGIQFAGASWAATISVMNKARDGFWMVVLMMDEIPR